MVMVQQDGGTAGVTARPARHGRPKPLGGRFKLPTLRFSGAAMAMSTVLGISAATTWLVTAQQHVTRRPGVSTVGASPPPLPSPDATPAPTPPPTPHPAIGPTAETPRPETPQPGTARPRTTPTPHFPPPARTSVTPAPTTPPPTVPQSAPPTTAPAEPPGDLLGEPLSGRAVRDLLGPSGTRHQVTLRVREPLTALQVELRLERPEVLPGTTPWSSLPGTVVTLSQERGALVYRFTAPTGPDVHPGDHTFGVRGTHNGPTTTKETWTASAFALRHPRALAIRGTFR